MNKFKIDREENKISSINRTIRIKPALFERLTLLSEASGVSFNKIVNQCIEFALENIDESEQFM